MKKAILYSLEPRVEVAVQVEIAESFFERLRGLLGRSSLSEGHAFMIPRCASVHMFFMRFPIDVLFCSRELEVLQLIEGLKPWRCSSYVPGAYYAVELPQGRIAALDIKIGQRLLLEGERLS